ncbi:cutinase family protein [Nocardia huaxiensis]|uniref:cutinase family protein n=1 Tax=Nocardia huaxiensis TaxID=2755382 RepID=UPI001E47305E|nr:cutinase family protein [Nocardia huaxiensis]UFS97537.1 cutinase family protein [Nocardia huaxiensis]
MAVVTAALTLPGVSVASAESSTVPADCAEVHIVTVRGTLEPQSGSLLLTPLARRIAQESGRTATVAELEYPASMAPDSAVRGVENLTALINNTAAECPNQRVVLLGYSQGARVIGNTLRTPTAVTEQAGAQIEAIAVFGSPLFNGADAFNRGNYDPALSGTGALPVGALGEFTDRVRSYCAAADRVCQGGDPAAGFANALSPGHFAYFVYGYRDDAAAFVRDQLHS